MRVKREPRLILSFFFFPSPPNPPSIYFATSSWFLFPLTLIIFLELRTYNRTSIPIFSSNNCPIFTITFNLKNIFESTKVKRFSSRLQLTIFRGESEISIFNIDFISNLYFFKFWKKFVKYDFTPLIRRATMHQVIGTLRIYG